MTESSFLPLTKKLFAKTFIALTLLCLWPSLPAQAVEVKKVVSPSGLEAWLVEDHRNPIISLDLLFRGGSTLDPEGKEGLARMVAGLIDEGSGPLDSQAFQKELEDRAIKLGFSANGESFTGGLQTLTEERDRAFEMLHLALTEARFDAEPVERIRGQILTALQRDSEDPQSILAEAWWQHLFPDHAYGRSFDGTEDGIKAITVKDMKAFTKQRFAKNNLIISVAGDITTEDLAVLLDKTFASLPETAQDWTLPKTTPQSAGKTLLIKRDMPQSMARFGHAGLQRSDPDWWPAYTLNYILGGGGFVSRLMEEVREKRGLAYSVYSYLYPLDSSALWIGGVATQNKRLKESLEVIRQEWADMAENGPTEQELKDAKTYLTGSFPLRLTSTDSLARTLTSMQRYELGMDYIDRRKEKIDAVTLEDLKKVARRLLQPADLTVMIIGAPEDLDVDGVLEATTLK